ncbi:MAG: motility associated factor glycosyltransferase family protein [Deltaproteobacteria bacterium]|nr:motility associated factor glycosyltransferase family protein [Deltaproteobacteria bacterium]
MDEGLYGKNSLALSRADPALITWLEGAEAPQGLGLVRTEVGTVDLVIGSESGKQVFYYGGSPSVDSELAVIRGMNLSRGSMTCLVGVGLGYTVGAMLREMQDGHHLMLLEPDPWILRQALSHLDLAQGISAGRIHVMMPADRAIEDLFLRLLSGGILHGSIKVIADPRSGAISGEYEAWAKRIEDAYRYANTLIESSTVVQKRSIDNEIDNTLHVSVSPGIETLRPLVRGRPVLLIGAGPSLDRSLDKIARVRSDMFLFAFAAAWRTLLSRGIEADFVLSSDKNPECLAMLRHTRFAHETPLIFSSSIHPEFLWNYTGPRFAVPQKGLYPLLPSHQNHSVSLGTGTSVAVFALNLAVCLEADPIALIGLDLAVGESTHASGHPLAGALDPDRPDLRETVGVGGKNVKSLTHLLDIKRHLEFAIRDSQVRVVNATVVGSHIEGTEEMDLDDLTRHLPALDKAVARMPHISPGRAMEKVPRKAMADLMKEVLTLRDLSETGVRHLDRFRKRLRKGRLDAGLAAELNQAGKGMQEFLVRHPLLNQYFSSTWLTLKQETEKALSIPDSRERVAAEVEKNHRALTEIRADSGKLLERMESRWGGMSADLGEDVPGRVRFFLDSGLIDEAYRECGNMGEGAPEVRWLGAEILGRKGLLSEAMGLLACEESDPGSEKRRVSLLRQLEEERGELLKEAEKTLTSGSPVDSRLVARELQRSLPGDVDALRLRERLMEKL